MRTTLVTVLLMTSAAACADEPPSTSAPAATTPASASAAHATASRLALRISPLLDLHYLARAGGDQPAETPAWLADAAAAAREVEAQLGGPRGWALLEPTLAACNDAGEAAERCARLPERFRSRSGAEIPVRSLATRLVAAYAVAQTEFRAAVWPEHERTLRAARQTLDTRLIPKQAACFQFLCASLGMTDPRVEIPVYLVARAPAPQGVTHRARGVGALCIVGVADLPPSLLCEVVLHEATHALDVATAGQGTVLEELARELLGAGVGPEDARLRDVPHTLIFVQAGETVRRLIDAEHRHYGDVRGYYAKVPAAARAVRTPWVEHLDGERPRAETVARIVESAAKERG